MAQPKRRWSKARTHTNCGEPILPHTLCSNCGYYDGKQIIVKKEKDNNQE